MIAPKRYHNDHLKGFDVRVNYEVVLDYFQNAKSLGNRKFYKISLINSAIEKSHFGYQKKEDLSVTKFWRDYWELSLDIAEELRMDEQDFKPASASFIYFRCQSLPKSVNLFHKLVHGHFDLQFKGMGNKIGLMNESYNHLLSEDMKIVKTGKSASIRIEVPKLTLADSLESQRNLVVTGMNIGKKLLSWCEKNVS